MPELCPAWPREHKRQHSRGITERTGRVSEIDFPEENLCETCLQGRKYDEKQHHLTTSSHDFFSAYGPNLVLSPNLINNSVDRNDVCLSAVDNIPELIGDVGFAVIVEDLLQSGYVHHTIRHPIPSRFEHMISANGTIWNIPLPYRSITNKERMDI